MSLRFHLSDSPYANIWGPTLYAYREGESNDGRVAVVHSPTVELMDPKEAGCFEPKALLTFDRADNGLQSLMDELWRIGVRPRDIGTAGHLAATQQHLGDMRTLVEKVLEVKFPPLK